MVMTWEGTHPQLKSIMLNSHYDVVPVFPVCDTYQPEGRGEEGRGGEGGEGRGEEGRGEERRGGGEGGDTLRCCPCVPGM